MSFSYSSVFVFIHRANCAAPTTLHEFRKSLLFGVVACLLRARAYLDRYLELPAYSTPCVVLTGAGIVAPSLRAPLGSFDWLRPLFSPTGPRYTDTRSPFARDRPHATSVDGTATDTPLIFLRRCATHRSPSVLVVLTASTSSASSNRLYTVQLLRSLLTAVRAGARPIVRQSRGRGMRV